MDCFFLILHLHSIWPVQEPLTQLCLENGIYPFQNESICPAASFPPFLSSSPSLYTPPFVANRAIIPPTTMVMVPARVPSRGPPV